ncbi:MAG TPA: PH domain-containing protein [Rhizobiales bacterium]|nr:PH domain-containing protein [Hyphomicrobiales bacterium]
MHRQSWARGRAHWTLFAPAILVALVYGLMWQGLVLLGRGDGSVARISLFVFAIGSPLLLVYGFLRYNSVWIALAGDDLCLARGWPRLTHSQISLDEIASIRLRQSFIGRRFNVGEILVETRSGRRYRVSDIAEPEAVVNDLNQALRAFRDDENPGS